MKTIEEIYEAVQAADAAHEAAVATGLTDMRELGHAEGLAEGIEQGGGTTFAEDTYCVVENGKLVKDNYWRVLVFHGSTALAKAEAACDHYNSRFSSRSAEVALLSYTAS